LKELAFFDVLKLEFLEKLKIVELSVPVDWLKYNLVLDVFAVDKVPVVALYAINGVPTFSSYASTI
jgi:hypothetical protein